MSDAFQAMLDSGLLYFVVGAVICVILGIGAAKRLFQGAKKAEPPDPQDRPRHDRSPVAAGAHGVAVDTRVSDDADTVADGRLSLARSRFVKKSRS